MRWNRRWLAALAGLLVLAGAANAQQRLGGSGGSGGFSGSSGSGGFGGSSGSSGSSGGFTGGGSISGSGGFTGGGSISGSGGFTGGGSISGSGGFTGSSGGSGSFSGMSSSRGGSSSYGQTSIVGRYYGNPLAAGYGGSTTSGSSSGTSSTRGTSGFGQPLVNTANLTKTSQLGTSSGALGGSGLGGNLGSSSLGQSRVTGASSMGTRRAPQYMTEPGFARNQPNQQTLPQPNPNVTPPQQPVNQLPAPTAVPLRREDLQKVIGGSTSLPSRENINVTLGTDGVVVLRGTVGSERERRLAETKLRLSPGVREVRNELQMNRTRR
jgi:hypothetical protein